MRLYGVPTSGGARSETAQAIDQKNGPGAFRRAIQEMTKGFDIPLSFEDCGDIKFEDTVDNMLAAVEEAVLKDRLQSQIPCLIGGSHTLTLGTLRALKKSGAPFSFLYFDAHPDMMPREDINYGSSIYHALKEGVVDPKRMCLIGARWIEKPEQEVIARYGIKILNPLAFEVEGVGAILQKLTQDFPPPYFISFDLDAVDSCLAQGATLPVPGGLTFREVQFLVENLAAKGLLAFELVELAPVKDAGKVTAHHAAYLIHSLARALG